MIFIFMKKNLCILLYFKNYYNNFPIRFHVFVVIINSLMAVCKIPFSLKLDKFRGNCRVTSGAYFSPLVKKKKKEKLEQRVKDFSFDAGGTE